MSSAKTEKPLMHIRNRRKPNVEPCTTTTLPLAENKR